MNRQPHPPSRTILGDKSMRRVERGLPNMPASARRRALPHRRDASRLTSSPQQASF
ncbi:hypothetical protein DM47_2153 [Burkholderia mallei]|nr:hypothetical protein DM75_3016 [Burkholderia mallei]KOS75854.1 hypothetical protein DM46_1561 [Burkholderia mallei]KOS92461.1 hypothetical protein DM45_2925 [Burkholderia mallei]KOS96701.1 hypothetical protein DM49_2892 [Burkholderia mallei]KOT01333.1 hypothetical protein DM50_3007 [Burkholderia mallei]